MLFAIGFLITFLFGGLTGVLLASPPIDFHVSDSYFVVAHFHYVLFGTVVFAMFAGFYFWWPKMTGTMLDERLGKIHFWTLFIGFHTTFLVQHWLGVEGMPRRYADYLPTRRVHHAEHRSRRSARYILGLSMLPFLYNAWRSWVGKNERVVGDDPWGYGNSLEWATSCPPPRHNFTSMPRIRSERPAFDLHYPHLSGLPELHATPGARRRGSAMKIEGYLFAFIAVFLLAGGHRLLVHLARPDRYDGASPWPCCSARWSSSYLFVTARRMDAAAGGPRRRRDRRRRGGDRASSARTAGRRCGAPASAAIVFAGIVFGWWLTFIGAAFAVPAVGLDGLRVLLGRHVVIREVDVSAETPTIELSAAHVAIATCAADNCPAIDRIDLTECGPQRSCHQTGCDFYAMAVTVLMTAAKRLCHLSERKPAADSKAEARRWLRALSR